MEYWQAEREFCRGDTGPYVKAGECDLALRRSEAIEDVIEVWSRQTQGGVGPGQGHGAALEPRVEAMVVGIIPAAAAADAVPLIP